MKISARNQLKGTVSSVSKGAVNGIVAIDLGEASVMASITMDAVDELGPTEGAAALAIVKSTDVIIGVE